VALAWSEAVALHEVGFDGLDILRNLDQAELRAGGVLLVQVRDAEPPQEEERY
jgi:hypothetical protein